MARKLIRTARLRVGETGPLRWPPGHGCGLRRSTTRLLPPGRLGLLRVRQDPALLRTTAAGASRPGRGSIQRELAAPRPRTRPGERRRRRPARRLPSPQPSRVALWRSRPRPRRRRRSAGGGSRRERTPTPGRTRSVSPRQLGRQAGWRRRPASKATRASQTMARRRGGA